MKKMKLILLTLCFMVSLVSGTKRADAGVILAPSTLGTGLILVGAAGAMTVTQIRP
jgi:hypothetical protein